MTKLSRKYGIILLALLMLPGLLTACNRTAPPFEYEIKVQALDSGAAITDAVVRAEIGVRDVYQATTDANGVAQLTIDGEHLGGWAKIIAEADNYQTQSILIKLTEEDRSATIGLERLSAAGPTQ